MNLRLWFLCFVPALAVTWAAVAESAEPPDDPYPPRGGPRRFSKWDEGRKRAIATAIAESSTNSILMAIQPNFEDLHRRRNSLFPDDDMHWFLNLVPVRKVGFFRPCPSGPDREMALFYRPGMYDGRIFDSRSGELVRADIPWFDNLLPDNQFRLVFAKHRTLPRPDRFGRNMATNLWLDYYSGTPEDFLKRHGLEDLFSDNVFDVDRKLSFYIEDMFYDAPKEDFIDDVISRDRNVANMDPVEKQYADAEERYFMEDRKRVLEGYRQNSSRELQLTRREVSEVVYLAYAYGGEADGPAAYRAALRANPDILVPIPDGRMETELGRRVEAELKAPPKAAAPPPEAAEPPEPPAPEPLSKEEFVRLWVGRKLTPLQIGTEMQRYSMQEQEELEEAWRQGVRKRDAAKPKPWDLPESYPAKILPGDGYPGRLEPWPETAELKARLAKYGFRAGAFQRDAFPDRFRPTDRFFPTNRLPYLLLAPDRRPPKPLPMVVYFGGWGEQGSDLLLPFRQTAVFDKVCDPAFRKRHPCVLFAPMIERTAVGVSTDGGPSPTQELICDAMYAVIRDLGPGVVDTNRLYLTGLSYGGRIAYDLVCVFPDRFAATVPVAADEPPGMIPEEWPENVWTLRNEGERTTPEDRERRAKAKARVRAAGGDFRESEFPAEGHDAWHAAWREDRVWDWMFSKTRDGRPAEGAAVAASAPVPEPLAARCTASAPERDARHRPEHAVDGLDGTAFVSGRPMGKGDWLQVEFESPVSGRIVVRTGDGSGRGTLSGGRVETSVDGRLWTRRASVSSRTGEARFSEPGRIRFLRLLPEPKAPEVLVVREIEAGAVR